MPIVDLILLASLKKEKLKVEIVLEGRLWSFDNATEITKFSKFRLTALVYALNTLFLWLKHDSTIN